jgi:hypothetical protein
MLCLQIQTAVVAARSPRAVRLGDHVEGRRPRRIGTADNAGCLQRTKLRFGNAEFVSVKATCLCKNRAPLCLNVVADAVPRTRGGFAIANNGGKSGQECADPWGDAGQRSSETRATCTDGCANGLESGRIKDAPGEWVDKQAVLGEEIDAQDWAGDSGKDERTEERLQTKGECAGDRSP